MWVSPLRNSIPPSSNKRCVKKNIHNVPPRFRDILRRFSQTNNQDVFFCLVLEIFAYLFHISTLTSTPFFLQPPFPIGGKSTTMHPVCVGKCENGKIPFSLKAPKSHFFHKTKVQFSFPRIFPPPQSVFFLFGNKISIYSPQSISTYFPTRPVTKKHEAHSNLFFSLTSQCLKNSSISKKLPHFFLFLILVFHIFALFPHIFYRSRSHYPPFSSWSTLMHKIYALLKNILATCCTVKSAAVLLTLLPKKSLKLHLFGGFEMLDFPSFSFSALDRIIAWFFSLFYHRTIIPFLWRRCQGDRSRAFS